MVNLLIYSYQNLNSANLLINGLNSSSFEVGKDGPSVSREQQFD